MSLYLSISDPLVKTDRTPIVARLTPNVYSHEIRRIGGYWQASFDITQPEETVNEWIQEGIGRHLEVYNLSHERIFEGFVNRLSLSQGENNFELGPLTDVGNRISVLYSLLNFSIGLTTPGDQYLTNVANDTISQGLYGIWHKIHTANGASTAQAEQLRDSILNDPTKSYPLSSGELNPGASGDFNLKVEVLGYWHFLLAYYYSNLVQTQVNLSDHIEALLGADINGIFSTDYSRIASNGFQVFQYADGQQTPDIILKNLLAVGDSSDNMYLMGFYNDRRMIYEQVVLETTYQQRRGRPITDPLGGPLHPWDILPGKWLFRPDFLVGRHLPLTESSYGQDPRLQLIESVKFSMPYSVQVSGGKYSTLDQQLAKKGLDSQ